MIKKLFFTGTIFIVFLVFIEFIFIIFNIGRPHYYQYDNILGSVHRPNAEGYWKAEGYTYIKINSKGQRDIEYNYRKDDNVYRICVLGDSFTEAFQVPLEKTFYKLLENKLNLLDSPQKYEVLNFGVSGYGTTQEYLMLKHKVQKYSPDLVVLAFCIGNDFRNNVKEIEPRHKRPFFVLNNGKLILDNSFREKYKYRENNFFKFFNYFVVRSHFFTLVFERLSLLKSSFNKSKTRKPGKASYAISKGFDVFNPNSTKLWSEVFELTNSVLLKIKKETDLYNSQFLLVSIPSKSQVTHDSSTTTGNNGVYDIKLPDKILGSFCKENNIKFLPLLPTFRDYWQQTKNPLFWGHFNLDGHKLAFSVISDYLMKSQILPPPI